MRLDDNEGRDWDHDLNILFTGEDRRNEHASILSHVDFMASTLTETGDLGNVIKTISSIPEDFGRMAHVVVNDKDMTYMARNAVMLLSAFLVEDPVEAASIMTHLWYSGRLTRAHGQVLDTLVRPQLQDACDKIANKPDGILHGKTWRFPDERRNTSSSTLRLVLTKEDWNRVLACLCVPEGFNADKADEARRIVTMKPSRIDHRDFRYLAMTVEHRVADYKFRTDGLLLPFGQSQAEFTVPNP